LVVRGVSAGARGSFVGDIELRVRLARARASRLVGLIGSQLTLPIVP